ncbi:hypothetical protein FB45DRAFT_936125 [Roridomyces roridus]|uniref:Uncharacterized protein n=1 Tax=Roridomyces roridus TaxID=1738132 RepID=A0AAD7B9K5_9AGAR|nr:hypothetical protein FB45DRAFT_936125 [Roridomyces roridus]
MGGLLDPDHHDRCRADSLSASVASMSGPKSMESSSSRRGSSQADTMREPPPCVVPKPCWQRALATLVGDICPGFHAQLYDYLCARHNGLWPLLSHLRYLYDPDPTTDPGTRIEMPRQRPLSITIGIHARTMCTHDYRGPPLVTCLHSAR